MRVPATPGKPLAIAAASASAASMSSPSAGLIWIVASREIWFCQTAAVSRTSVTAPSVRQDRKVMMAMTEISARPATFCAGTIGAMRALDPRGVAIAVGAAPRPRPAAQS